MDRDRARNRPRNRSRDITTLYVGIDLWIGIEL